ncbi:MAG: type III-B CRISPR module RAMP protein Cmr4 [Thermogutta sp.]|nr:type III-B CRISPR module RAMP protein Cmr4 [Thermogutta sp.]HPU06627.1 type III-B CRISPR module RAMP protein Cmr4 [Thermogutta sp.]HQF12370.1 type III-B CRISPR module RAMP protein Cmr4 [Thermogutta sp.]
MSNSLNGRSAATLFLHAQTGLHPGTGTALGVVDLPVQRERHTQWPTIAASALKGILRDVCREKAKADFPNGETLSPRRWANERHQKLVAAFGPGIPEESSEHAGAVALTDARILAFPVRSLRGVFAWVTCPAAVQRLNRDLALTGLQPLDDIPAVLDNEIACTSSSPLLVSRNPDKVVLEEFDFNRIQATCDQLAEWMAHHAVADAGTQSRLRWHLAVLSDNDFSYFVRHATEIVARIALDYERKTVKEGALFYEEFLPAETIFYTLILASESRKPDVKLSAAEILEFVRRCVEAAGVIQIGGDETTGKGLCTVRWLQNEEA